VIRAEILSCKDPVNELIYTTCDTLKTIIEDYLLNINIITHISPHCARPLEILFNLRPQLFVDNFNRHRVIKSLVRIIRNYATIE